MFITLIPAYGRDYKSAAAAKADWLANKDFRIACFHHPNDGQLMNKEQAVSSDTYNIRYSGGRKVVKV